MLLLHSLPDGTSHFDLLLSSEPDPQDADARCLIALRLDAQPNFAEAGAIACERMENHRAHYLDYEGEVSGGWGEVRRVKEFEVWWTAAGGDSFEFELIHGAGIARCVLDNAPAGAQTTLSVVPAGGAGR